MAKARARSMPSAIWVDAKSGLLRRLDLKNITGESSIVFDPIANEPIPDELLKAGPTDSDSLGAPVKK